MLTNLERLTSVIPSRNRQEYLLRAIKVWSNTPVQLLLLDGTATPLELNETVVNSGKIQYKHLVVPLEQRLGKSTEFITTEYVACFVERDEPVCKARATSSFPVPLSPRINTLASDVAAWRIKPRNSLTARLLPMIKSSAIGDGPLEKYQFQF